MGPAVLVQDREEKYNPNLNKFSVMIALMALAMAGYA